MDEKMDTVASKVNSLQDTLKEKEAQLESCLNATQKIHMAEVEKIDAENEEKLKELNEKYLQEKRKLEEKEKNAFADFEKFLAEHLSKISTEWTKKLQTADDKISSYQKELQDLIHNKHQQSSIKNDMLLQEDRRMAAEHERISREFNERKLAADQKIRQLSVELKSLQDSLENESNSAQSKFEALEKNLLNQRKELEDERNQELLALMQKISSLNSDVQNKKLEIDGEKANTAVKIREIEKEYEQKYAFEESETKRLIAEALQAIDNHYNPKISALNKQIEEAELKRGQTLECLRKSALSDVESGENEVAELNKRHDEERKRLRSLLAREKENLNQLLQEKNADIDELKHKMQKELGDSMTNFDAQERLHADEISNLMRQFDEQQKKLSDFQRLTLEQRNRRKADELTRLKQEHEQRKNQILFRVEQQMKIEAEKALNESINQANQEHSQEISSMNTMLLDIKGRMDMLQMKIEGLYKMHNQRLEQMMQDHDDKLREDLKKIQEEGNREKANIKDLKQRILSETQEVDRRKELVLKEANELDQNIQDMHDKFEKKMRMMEHQFSAAKNKIQMEQREVKQKQVQLTNQLDDQKMKIHKLGEIAANKEAEANQFEENYEQNKEKFHKETVEQYEANLNEVKMDPHDFEYEMEDLRDTLTSQMQSLQEQLAAAKENTIKTTKLMMVEREHALEEAEAEMRLQSEERIKQITENHEKRVELMKSEFEATKKAHEEKMADIHKTYKEQIEGNEIQFKNLIKELIEEKGNLEKASVKLDDQIIELENRECPSCIEKKEVIKVLMIKRDELKVKLDGMHKQVIISEKKMNTLFPETQKRTTSSLTTLVPKAKILQPKKVATDFKL
ncbi:hypothetical protein TRFO_08295 [Tritrichomonas foetus]|uniref:Uncharacterized protein n=1 Tax=Tritrichomonas foetus TaxID=1144522 RepID=A0A1J4JKK8_9EUKA|nr:hypothetical protein TRFO_08295 [Tritrichomonas foetus]|eukprot:OHS99664.1 hypothetical protein TRFO_08295 [Tritrichomonas foetus]